MNNKYYNYKRILDFDNIKYIQFILKDPNNPEHNSKLIEEKFDKQYIPWFKVNKPSKNLLLTHLNLDYNGQTKIYLTTPVMPCVFGLEKSFNSFQFKLSFTDIDTNPKIKEFYDVIKTVEYSQMMSIGITDKNETDYISQIKQDDEEKYPPHITIKLPFRYNKFEVDIYNKNMSGMGITNIRARQLLCCNIYIDSIQKFNGKYMCKWKCSYIDVKS
jgi:hypothetical protein